MYTPQVFILRKYCWRTDSPPPLRNDTPACNRNFELSQNNAFLGYFSEFNSVISFAGILRNKVFWSRQKHGVFYEVKFFRTVKNTD